MNKPRTMTQERYDELKEELKVNINYLFAVQEVIGHAFTDFYSSARKLGLGMHEFKRNQKGMIKSLQWFSHWYQDAFKDDEDKIEALGQAGDRMHEEMKGIFLTPKHQHNED